MTTAQRRWWAAAAAGLAFAALSPALSATAAPAQTSGAATLVNGAGRTVTLSPSAIAALSSTAGHSSYVPTGAKPATTKSAPKASPDSVLGPDGRVQEGPTTVYPWGSIVHIESTIGGCTGFLLNRDTVVTAGHCVFLGGWATSYTVTPGRNGVNVQPYGSCSGGSGDLWSNTIWTGSQNEDFDYGMIKLTCDVGNSTGWMGWWYNEGETLTGQFFYVEGFPGDKPYGTMWWDGDTIASQTGSRLFHNIDTFGGESGSPIYRFRSASEGLCAGWCITGIHTTGGSVNGGTRFNSSVMGIINFVVGLP